MKRVFDKLTSLEISPSQRFVNLPRICFPTNSQNESVEAQSKCAKNGTRTMP